VSTLYPYNLTRYSGSYLGSTGLTGTYNPYLGSTSTYNPYLASTSTYNPYLMPTRSYVGNTYVSGMRSKEEMAKIMKRSQELIEKTNELLKHK